MFTLMRLAVRNLTRNRRRTLLTLAAIAVGVTAVVGVRGFLNGLQASFILGVTEGTLGAIQVHRTGYLASMETNPLRPSIREPARLMEQLEKVPGVVAVAPRIMFGGMVNVGDETAFAVITGVDPARELKVCPRREMAIVEGKWIQPGSNEAHMSMEVARGLSAKVGSTGAVLTNDVDGVMNAAEMKVAGTVAAFTQGEKRSLMIPLPVAQELLRMDGEVTEVALSIHTVEETDEVAARVRAALSQEYEVSTWKDLASFARDAQEYQNTALNIISAIFMFIMLMGLMNTMLMSVMERVREIGTMVAVGTRRRQVLILFLWEAAILGVLGAAIGSAVGTTVVTVLGATGIRVTTPGASLPQLIIPYIHAKFLLRMVLMSGAGASIAAMYPAWKASRMRPVEALAAV